MQPHHDSYTAAMHFGIALALTLAGLHGARACCGGGSCNGWALPPLHWVVRALMIGYNRSATAVTGVATNIEETAQDGMRIIVHE